MATFLFIVGAGAGAAALTLLTNWLCLIPWRRRAAGHWTERARLLWPARVAAGLNPWLIAGLAAVSWILAFPDDRRGCLWPFLVAWAAATLSGFSFARELFPTLRLRDWLHQLSVGWGLRLGFLAAFGAGIVLMPQDPDWRCLLIFAAVLGLQLGIQWGLALRVLRALGTIRPAPQRLERVAAEVATRMRVVVRGVWIMEGQMALAFAFPTTHDLVFSRRLLDLAGDDELAAIAAHEVAHLSETKGVLAGRVLGSLTLFPLLFLRPAIHSLGFAGVALLATAVALWSVYARRLSLRMERRADRIAVEHQLQEGTYARALERLYEVNHLPAVNPDNRRTHPHLYDRLLSAGITPGYPRPAPPGRMAWTTVVLGIAFVALMVAVLMP